MSDDLHEKELSRVLPGRMSGLALLVAIALAVAAFTFLRERTDEPRAREARLHERPRALPAFTFEDGDGRTRTLADWKGRVVVLNVWATWCVPCRVEMPSLARLQAALGDAPVDLVALSVDHASVDVVRRYYRDNGLDALRLYRTSFDTAEKALRVPGIPTTIIVDREGNEAGRVIGENVWDRAEVVAMLKALADRPAATEIDPPTKERLPLGP